MSSAAGLSWAVFSTELGRAFSAAESRQSDCKLPPLVREGGGGHCTSIPGIQKGKICWLPSEPLLRELFALAADPSAGVYQRHPRSRGDLRRTSGRDLKPGLHNPVCPGAEEFSAR